MRLHIASQRLISDIQKEFNRRFPFLKIDFFNNKLFNRSGFSIKHIVLQNLKIGDAQWGIREGDIEIAEEMKVSELERIFRDEFNLAIQVARKSGNLWLEISMTDNWTLQQQNNHGKELSTEESRNEKTEDYDLTRDADH